MEETSTFSDDDGDCEIKLEVEGRFKTFAADVFDRMMTDLNLRFAGEAKNVFQQPFDLRLGDWSFDPTQPSLHPTHKD